VSDRPLTHTVAQVRTVKPPLAQLTDRLQWKTRTGEALVPKEETSATLQRAEASQLERAAKIFQPDEELRRTADRIDRFPV